VRARHHGAPAELPPNGDQDATKSLGKRRWGWESRRPSSAPSPSETNNRRKSGFTECDCADRLMGSCGASRAGLPTGPPWDQLPPFLPHVRGAGCPARCSCCCWLRRRAPFRTSVFPTRPRTARTSSLTRERQASTVAGPARHALRAARASSTMTARAINACRAFVWTLHVRTECNPARRRIETAAAAAAARAHRARAARSIGTARAPCVRSWPGKAPAPNRRAPTNARTATRVTSTAVARNVTRACPGARAAYPATARVASAARGFARSSASTARVTATEIPTTAAKPT